MWIIDRPSHPDPAARQNHDIRSLGELTVWPSYVKWISNARDGVSEKESSAVLDIWKEMIAINSENKYGQ